MRPILLGVCAAFFFASTFVLNRSMELSGGSWLWSASLRYIFMVPFLLGIVIGQKKLRGLLRVMKEHPGLWLLWSFVGFVLFYAPICYAAAYSPGWLTAGTWQITIISGSLLAPIFTQKVQTGSGPVHVRGRIPLKGLGMSMIILAGIILMQADHAGGITSSELLAGLIPVLIASFAYPLGNRKMMQISGDKLNTFQRVLGMTLASLPFWLILSAIAYAKHGMPGKGQIMQSFLVAIFSGVIATVLFFKATDMVRDDMDKMASVEATQSVSVLFALLGEVLFLSSDIPSLLAWTGVLTVMLGMVLHSFSSRKKIVTVNQQLGTKA
ncbi:DMT family transporter [Peribacillus kribbensis]|uniref:DMT family transporter n=1 Tax=Peribacillus kribbensis TaxID=356658 RepID=UPI00040E44D4|nr:multidrug resistance efflux transporter family protein [Peribacillus kribbensis]